MKIPVEYDYTKETKRWLAYFDLLGFSSHFKDQKDKANQILMAFNIYAPCLEAIKRKQQRIPELQYVWFSDSFLIYAPDDSGEMFLSMLSAYEWFFAELIRNNIPVQGALACDQFYADAESGIYLGRALVEACRYAEGYDWIGFVLCPSAVQRINEVGYVCSEKLIEYKNWKPPKSKRATKELSESIMAYLLGFSSPVNGKIFFIGKLEDMAKSAKEGKQKYDNTVQFLKHFGVVRIGL
jgi:hypothetical protein